jgi:hypothetical protein
MFKAKARQQHGAVLLTNCPIFGSGGSSVKMEIAESFILQSSSLATAYSDRAGWWERFTAKQTGKNNVRVEVIYTIPPRIQPESKLRGVILSEVAVLFDPPTEVSS